MTRPDSDGATMHAGASVRVATDIDGVAPLVCPACGQQDRWAFSASTYVLIDGRTGLPTVVADYSLEQQPIVECHACDHAAPVWEFSRAQTAP